MSRPLRALLLLPGWLAFAAGSAEPPPPGAVQHWPDTIPWTAAPPSMPAGTQLAVLEGDPQAPRWFTVRMKVPAGAVLRPHWHPRDERATVLSGRVAVGFGETIDATAVTRFGPGSFYVNPANRRHYVLFVEDSVVQVTGVGPWEVRFVEPAPAP